MPMDVDFEATEEVIGEKTYTIGRGPHPELDLCLYEDAISSRHARIEFSNGKYYLSDTGSLNGTWFDGEKMAKKQPRELKEGSEVVFGLKHKGPFIKVKSISSGALFTGPKCTIQVKRHPFGFSPAASGRKTRASSQRNNGGDGRPPPFERQSSAATIAADSDSDGASDAGSVRTRIDFDDGEGHDAPWTDEKEISVGNDTFSIGRKNVCDLFLQVAEISGSHGKIEYDPIGRKFTFRDVGSTNGSWVNGDKVKKNYPSELKKGTVVTLGLKSKGPSITVTRADPVKLFGTPVLKATVRWRSLASMAKPRSQGSRGFTKEGTMYGDATFYGDQDDDAMSVATQKPRAGGNTPKLKLEDVIICKIYDQVFTVGRKDFNDLVLCEAEISGTHSKIEYDKSSRAFLIRDLSTNGTWIDGDRLMKGDAKELKKGMVVTFGLKGSGPHFIVEKRKVPRMFGKPKLKLTVKRTPLPAVGEPLTMKRLQERDSQRRAAADEDARTVRDNVPRRGGAKTGAHANWEVLQQVVGQSTFTMGRKAGSSLTFVDECVSGAHAKFDFSKNKFVIEDVGSTNGTYLNRSKLRKEHPRELKVGDTISLGKPDEGPFLTVDRLNVGIRFKSPTMAVSVKRTKLNKNTGKSQAKQTPSRSAAPTRRQSAKKPAQKKRK